MNTNRAVLGAIVLVVIFAVLYLIFRFFQGFNITKLVPRKNTLGTQIEVSPAPSVSPDNPFLASPKPSVNIFPQGGQLPATGI